MKRINAIGTHNEIFQHLHRPGGMKGSLAGSVGLSWDETMGAGISGATLPRFGKYGFETATYSPLRMRFRVDANSTAPPCEVTALMEQNAMLPPVTLISPPRRRPRISRNQDRPSPIRRLRLRRMVRSEGIASVEM